MSGRVRAFAELARLSNAPTCVSNVLAGCAIAAAGGTLRWGVAASMSVAVTLLYVAGMALNDLVDLDVDRRERPERPLPSGRIAPWQATAFILACTAGGVGIAALHGATAVSFALGLVIAIVVYDLFHKKLAASVLVMGACRSLVYITAAAAAAGGFNGAWPRTLTVLAAALGLYVVLITVVARVETTERRWSRFHLAFALPVVALLPLALLRPEPWWLPAIGAAVAAAWIIRSSAHLRADPPAIGCAVAGWLAGICLVDATYLLLLDQPTAATVAAACFAATVLAQKKLPGT